MSIKSIIRQAKTAFSSWLFSCTIGRSIEFPHKIASIYGSWPIISNKGKMVIGQQSAIRCFRLRPCLTVRAKARLEIGANAFNNDGVNICASHSIIIGHSAKIGDMVYIYDTDFHAVTPQSSPKQQPVQIGDNVWIGANCMILAGSHIGSHSVIAAGSVVTGEIPAKCLAAGTPARVVRTFEAPENWVRT